MYAASLFIVLVSFLIRVALTAADNVTFVANSHIILPGTTDNRHTEEFMPILKVPSQSNETRLSRRHPFACWNHPDFFSTKRHFYPADSRQQFELTCWTKSISAQPNTQNRLIRSCQDDDVSWFKTRDDCWIPSFNVQVSGSNDLREKLKYCPTPLHFIGTFREQYEGKSYCYTCTKLDCGAKPRAHERGGFVDLNCWKIGDRVDGDE
jgi:hypothetical protein